MAKPRMYGQFKAAPKQSKRDRKMQERNRKSQKETGLMKK